MWLNEKVEQNPRIYIISYENGWYSDNLNEFYFVIVIITNDKNLKYICCIEILEGITIQFTIMDTLSIQTGKATHRLMN